MATTATVRVPIMSCEFSITLNDEPCRVTYIPYKSSSGAIDSSVRKYFSKTQFGIEYRTCSNHCLQACSARDTFITSVDGKELLEDPECTLFVVGKQDNSVDGCYCEKHLTTPCFAAVNYCNKPLLHPPKFRTV